MGIFVERGGERYMAEDQAETQRLSPQAQALREKFSHPDPLPPSNISIIVGTVDVGVAQGLPVNPLATFVKGIQSWLKPAHSIPGSGLDVSEPLEPGMASYQKPKK